VVIADRTRDSSVVYQGIVRGFGEELIEKLNGISTKNTYPDVTFLLDVDEKIGLKRRATEGGMDRIDLEKTDFHKQVREGYLRLAQKDKTGRWEVIDASKSVEKVHEEIMAMLKKRKLWR
jgi:dTMP kinase